MTMSNCTDSKSLLKVSRRRVYWFLAPLALRTMQGCWAAKAVTAVQQAAMDTASSSRRVLLICFIFRYSSRMIFGMVS